SCATSDVRVTPWRQLLVTGVADADAAQVSRALDALGLVVDPAHPAGSVVACAGARGCASGHVDTLIDAAALVHDLLGVLPIDRPASIHVSGCEKGCASPGRTEVAIVGIPGGRYDLHRGSTAVVGDPVERRFGARAATALAPDEARHAVLAAGRGTGQG